MTTIQNVLVSVVEGIRGDVVYNGKKLGTWCRENGIFVAKFIIKGYDHTEKWNNLEELNGFVYSVCKRGW